MPDLPFVKNGVFYRSRVHGIAPSEVSVVRVFVVFFTGASPSRVLDVKPSVSGSGRGNGLVVLPFKGKNDLGRGLLHDAGFHSQ